ncbi:hypothetical protein NE237_022072 [Protea cynaroides]|uniref:FAD-binding domain-containing protein n=1 Tax=Protea cynaroides TaxID=273540 RepID=A0A9Q0JT10_9MAGN|nr:hypothetical protein NE237_022072 [Protea cynaroides]
MIPDPKIMHATLDVFTMGPTMGRSLLSLVTFAAGRSSEVVGALGSWAMQSGVQTFRVFGNPDLRNTSQILLMELLKNYFLWGLTGLAMDPSSSIAIISLDDGTIIKAKVVIGCDGVNSVVAHWLGLAAPVNFGRSGLHGLVVFSKGHGYKDEVYKFIDEGKRACFVPLNDKELSWFFLYKSSLKETTANHKLLQKDVMENLAKDFPPSYSEFVEHTDMATLTWAQLKFRYPWDLIFGHVCEGNITVTGDAMHPMTLDLGQSGCLALEDAVVLG